MFAWMRETRRRRTAAAVIASAVLLAAAPVLAATPAVIAPKVLTITMFQTGDPLAGGSGEASIWVEKDKLDQVVPIDGSYSPLYCNAAFDHCLVITGIMAANAPPAAAGGTCPTSRTLSADCQLSATEPFSRREILPGVLCG